MSLLKKISIFTECTHHGLSSDKFSMKSYGEFPEIDKNLLFLAFSAVFYNKK